MNAPVNIKADTSVPVPTNSAWGNRLAVVFYNRRLDGSTYAERTYCYPKRSIAYLNGEASYHLRDHFAVYNASGELIHNGPVLNALGNPITTYSEQLARCESMVAPVGSGA